MNVAIAHGFQKNVSAMKSDVSIITGQDELLLISANEYAPTRLRKT